MARDYVIKLGTMLFTMVEPTKGHEVEYNRWYERDHFYGGVLTGAWSFAGDRFVATKAMKNLRYPAESPMTPDPMTGSYLALYWVLDGHHDDWNEALGSEAWSYEKPVTDELAKIAAERRPRVTWLFDPISDAS